MYTVSSAFTLKIDFDRSHGTFENVYIRWKTKRKRSLNYLIQQSTPRFCWKNCKQISIWLYIRLIPVTTTSKLRGSGSWDTIEWREENLPLFISSFNFSIWEDFVIRIVNSKQTSNFFVRCHYFDNESCLLIPSYCGSNWIFLQIDIFLWECEWVSLVFQTVLRVSFLLQPEHKVQRQYWFLLYCTDPNEIFVLDSKLS